MLKKIMHGILALALAAGISLSSMQSAEARGGRGAGLALGVAAGIIGLGILGATAAPRHHHRGPVCYRGDERCGWRDRHCFINSWGDEVCRGGRYTCWRPTHCE